MSDHVWCNRQIDDYQRLCETLVAEKKLILEQATKTAEILESDEVLDSARRSFLARQLRLALSSHHQQGE